MLEIEAIREGKDERRRRDNQKCRHLSPQEKEEGGRGEERGLRVRRSEWRAFKMMISCPPSSFSSLGIRNGIGLTHIWKEQEIAAAGAGCFKNPVIFLPLCKQLHVKTAI